MGSKFLHHIPASGLSKLFYILLCIFACTGISCAAVPDANAIIKKAENKGAAPKIIGAEGPLSVEQSLELLKDISEDDLLRRHEKIEQAIAETPLVADNHTRILHDGKEAFPAIFAAIKNARRHINLEYYILQDVTSGGVKLSDLLLQKRREGVEINIIYDSFGSSETPSEFFDTLKRAGVRLVEFNPINPLKANDSPNDRNHRKILAVDGSIGIVGGINLSDTYESNVGKSGGPKGTTPEEWHDIALEIRGPVVAQLESLFLQHWKQQDGPDIDTRTFFPKAKDKGEEMIRIVGSTPDKAIPRYYVTLLSAIRNARQSVWLTTGYFVPPQELIDDVKAAARRGVDVRILLPSQSDAAVAVAVQHTHYTDLLEAGVKIYEIQGLILHSKMNVIDGVWSTVGSSNLDHRSVIFNDEVDAVIVGKKTAQDVERVFRNDFSKSDQITLEEWQDRPFFQRFYESFSRLFETAL